MSSRAAMASLLRDALAILAPPPSLTVSQWADTYRMLSPEASAEPGRWDTRRAEYQRAIMDAVHDPNVREVVVMSSAQVGKSEVLCNVLGYFIHQDPSPCLMLQPTVEMAESFAKDRISTMVRDTPELRERIADPKSRDSGNTTLHKRFPGGHLTLAGANSPAALASRPIRVVLCDEVDRYPVSAGPEGDPVALAVKRTAAFPSRKVVLTSTPTVAGASRIESAWNLSDQRRFFVPCAHCGESRVLSWDYVSYPDKSPENAVYSCPACGTVWTDADRLRAIHRGQWRPTADFRGVAGFHLNEFYSPFRTVVDVARDYEAAKAGGPEQMRVWHNTSLGLPYEEPGETADHEGLRARAEAWSDLPAGVMLLTAGVDVQSDRLEVEVVGWGVGEESWSVDYAILPGNPAQGEVWADLTAYLSRRWRRDDTRELSVEAAGVDTGFLVRQVFEFCVATPATTAWPLKGMSGARPVVELGATRAKRLQQTRVGNKYRPYLVGVDEAKLLLYRRIARVTVPGPGYLHVPKGRAEEWFLQLTAERLVTKPGGVREWVKTRSRNEALDCRVYAYAAMKLLAPDLSVDRAGAASPVPYRPVVRAYRGGGRKR